MLNLAFRTIIPGFKTLISYTVLRLWCQMGQSVNEYLEEIQ